MNDARGEDAKIVPSLDGKGWSGGCSLGRGFRLIDKCASWRRRPFIDLLAKQKAELDGRLALEGMTATTDLVQEKKRLDAELDLLKAKADIAKANGTSDLDLTNTIMKERLEGLQTQIDMLKKQAELQKLQAQKD